MKTFNQADKVVQQALAKLSSPEMLPLLAFINNLLEETKDALVHADGTTVPKLQGRATALEDLVEAASKAPDIVRKLP